MKGSFVISIVFLTVVAAGLALYAVVSVDVSGLVSTDFTAADVIRMRCPFHIFRPEWISAKDETDLLFNWVTAETKARLMLVISAWLLGLAFIVRSKARSRG